MRKLGDSGERRLALIDVRRMPAVFQHQRFYRTGGLLLGKSDLRRRAVLVVGALHDQDRNAHMGEAVVYAPVPRAGVEPCGIPNGEGGVDVLAVVPPEPLAQVAPL